MSEDKICKIYGSNFWHDSVEIVGSKSALTDMRDAIDEAIKNKIGKTKLMESDGEGYTVRVHCEERSWDQWCELPNHYNEEFAARRTEDQKKELRKIIEGSN